jgi:hypothetical protein
MPSSPALIDRLPHLHDMPCIALWLLSPALPSTPSWLRLSHLGFVILVDVSWHTNGYVHLDDGAIALVWCREPHCVQEVRV